MSKETRKGLGSNDKEKRNRNKGWNQLSDASSLGLCLLFLPRPCHRSDPPPSMQICAKEFLLSYNIDTFDAGHMQNTVWPYEIIIPA